MVDALSIDGSGGSVGRAVAHFSDSNVSVLRTAHLVRRTEQRLVRLYYFLVSDSGLSFAAMTPSTIIPKAKPRM